MFKPLVIPYDVNGLLVDHVKEIFQNAGHPNPDFVRNHIHPDALGGDHNLQRFLINRALRIELGSYQENTIEVRQCLIDQGKIEDWLRLLEQGVAPCIVRNVTQPKIN